MKFLAVFAAILAVALGAPSHWTLDQLSEAIENPTTNPSLIPILEQALNTFMTSIFSGESHQYISVTTAPVDLNTWSLSELSEAIENPNTNPALLPYLENAVNTLMNAIFAGEVQATNAQAAITIPALEISYWTLAEVDQALMNPTTSPALFPYLEQALNTMMANLFNGVQGASTIVLATPLAPATPTPVTPELVLGPGFEVTPVQVAETPVKPELVLGPGFEVIPVHVADTPVKPELVLGPGFEVTPVQVAETPVKPELVLGPGFEVTPVVDAPVGPAIVTPVAVESAPAAPAVTGSPLVQIILNINQKESVVPEAVITPTPVSVPDNTEAFPNPRPEPESTINPEPVILPSPPTPEVVVPEPSPVIIAPDFNPIDDIMISPPEINPIDVIAVVPEPDVNPIDVIAVMPEPVNPIDAIAVAAPDVNPIDLLSPIQPVAVIGGDDFGPM